MDGVGLRPNPANGRYRLASIGAVRPLLFVGLPPAFDQHICVGAAELKVLPEVA